MKNNTLDYYDKNADIFVESTVHVDFRAVQDKFLAFFSGDGCKILDFGCGAGRDTKYFLEKGYDVDAVDGSIELCRRAGEYTGIKVQHMLFQDLNVVEKYDGIWACASILHLTRSELIDVLSKISRALCNNGILYTSFKYGTFEGERNGRYFIDLNEESFQSILANIPELELIEIWITGDVRNGRGEERWLNLILKKNCK